MSKSARMTSGFVAAVMGATWLVALGAAEAQDVVKIAAGAPLTGPLAKQGQEVANAVVREPVLFVDETSWREGGVLHWLWVVVSRHYVYYRLDRHRNREACRA